MQPPSAQNAEHDHRQTEHEQRPELPVEFDEQELRHRLQQHGANRFLRLKNLDFKQTKPFRTARQDDRDIFDCRAWLLVSTAPTDPIDFRCRPQIVLLSSIMPSGGLKPIDLSGAPVSIS